MYTKKITHLSYKTCNPSYTKKNPKAGIWNKIYHNNFLQYVEACIRPVQHVSDLAATLSSQFRTGIIEYVSDVHKVISLKAKQSK